MEREGSILKKRTMRKMKANVPLSDRELYEIKKLISTIVQIINKSFKLITSTIRDTVDATVAYMRSE